MEMTSYMEADDTGTWYASDTMPEEDGSFEWTATFRPRILQSPTWDFLLDGEGEIMVWGSPLAMIAICSETIPPPSAFVSDATLIIDADFTSPTESATWGRIKALY